jgi:hypothetical protein
MARRRGPRGRCAIAAGMSRPIIFTCPQTGMQVQHWLPDVPEDEKDNHTCTKRHFIHNTTGRLLGEKWAAIT